MLGRSINFEHIVYNQQCQNETSDIFTNLFIITIQGGSAWQWKKILQNNFVLNFEWLHPLCYFRYTDWWQYGVDFLWVQNFPKKIYLHWNLFCFEKKIITFSEISVSIPVLYLPHHRKNHILFKLVNFGFSQFAS